MPMTNEIEALIAEYRTAYFVANGKSAPRITYEDGWFGIGENPAVKHRRRAIEQMRDELKRRAEHKDQGHG